MSSEPPAANNTTSGPPLYAGRGTTPVPDPTILTTQALAREIAGLREILEAQINGDKRILETRLDGMDRAIELLQRTQVDEFPTLVGNKISNLEKLHSEKFNGVEQQFASVQRQFVERDVRTEQTSQAAKEAVNTAFLAAKEAVAAALQAAKDAVAAQNDAFTTAVSKSEGTTTKQLDNLGMLIQTTTNGLKDAIDDVKARVALIEGRGSGFSASWSIAVALIGTLLGVAGFVFAVTR